mgnify:CR=1 FL=1
MPTITTPANANLTVTGSTTTLTITGTKGTSNEVVGLLKINNVQVGSTSYSTAGTSYSMSISLDSTVRNAIYTAANGYTLTGCVDIVVDEFTSSEVFVSSASRDNGTLNIVAVLTSFNVTTANPYDLDSPTNLTATWSRPHSAFRGRIKVSVNGDLCINRYGFSTSCSFDPVSLGYLDDMITAMDGVSPGSIVFELVTQFNANTIVDVQTGGTGNTVTRSTGIIMDTYTASTVSNTSVSHNLDTDANTSLTVNITRMDSSMTHTVKYQYYSSSTWNTLLTASSVATSTTFSFTTANLNTLYAAFTTTNSVPMRIEVTTYIGAEQIGSPTTKTGTATIINANPTFSTNATYTDTNTTIQTLLGSTTPKTLLQSKSTPSVTAGTATAVKSATISSYRVRHGATQSTSATSTIAVTADKMVFTTDTVVYVDVIDSRGNVGTQELLWIVKPYTAPVRSVNLAYRQDNYGTTGYIEIAWNVQSILVSSVEKNTGYAQYRLKTVGGAYGTAVAITDTASTSGGRLNYSKTSGDGGVVTIGTTLDANTAYVVELGIRDAVNTTYDTAEYTIGKASPFFQMKEDMLIANVPMLMPNGSGITGSGTGTANLSYLEFNESDGTTRQGYIGKSSGATPDINIATEVTNGNIRLIPNGSGVAYVGGGTNRILTTADQTALYTTLWTGTLDAAAETGTLSSAYTNYDFLIVTGYMDNANSENMVPIVIPTGVIGTNARQFSLNHSFTASSVSYANFHFSNSTTIYLDTVGGAYVESIRGVYGVNVV